MGSGALLVQAESILKYSETKKGASLMKTSIIMLLGVVATAWLIPIPEAVAQSGSFYVTPKIIYSYGKSSGDSVKLKPVMADPAVPAGFLPSLPGSLKAG